MDPHAKFDKNFFIHPTRGGLPKHIWVYRNEAGEAQTVGALYNGGGVPHEMLSWEWHATHYESSPVLPNVLYGLERLAAAPDKRVLVTDSLESADRAQELWAGRGACLAVMGGWQATDYSPLRNKVVAIWCESGALGDVAAKQIAAAIEDIAKTVKLVSVDKPERWSLADALDDEAVSLLKLAKLTLWDHAPLTGRETPPLAAYADEPNIIKPEPAPPQQQDESEEIGSVCAAQVQVMPLRPMWEGVLYRGKVTLLAGDPGVFKSGVTLHMAARISRGERFPLCQLDNAPGNVIIVSAEDTANDTIKPRLIAAGADCDRIYFAALSVLVPNPDGSTTSQPVTLDQHMAALERLIVKRQAMLLVIDPIAAFMGKANSHNNAEVRGVLIGLSQIAERCALAIVVVSHLNKSTEGSAVNRVSGSLAFAAAARAVFMVLKDENDPKRRLLLAAKNNLSADTRGFAFTIAVADNGYPYACWEEQGVSSTAQEFMGVGTARDRARDARTEEATKWLQGYLVEPMPTHDVRFEANRLGFTKRALQERPGSARSEAPAERLQGGWFWELPAPSNR